MRRLLLLAIALAATVAASGCTGPPGPGFDVVVENDSGEPVEVRFRIAQADGSGGASVTSVAETGTTVIGRVGGSPGLYRIEAWAFGERAEAGPFRLDQDSRCRVRVAGPEWLAIECIP